MAAHICPGNTGRQLEEGHQLQSNSKRLELQMLDRSAYRCWLCVKSFPNRLRLRDHVGKVHNRRPEKPESPLATKEAGNESFDKVTFLVVNCFFTVNINFYTEFWFNVQCSFHTTFRL